MNHAIRVSRPFIDISGAIEAWSDKSERLVVYQHDADEEVNRTHCHFALYGCTVKAEQLKRDFRKKYKTEDDGNGLWAFKSLNDVLSEDDTCLTLTFDQQKQMLDYIKYMTKGKLDPVFVKNISPAILDKAKGLWEQKAPVQKPAKSKETRDYWTFLENVRKDAQKHEYYTQELNENAELILTVDKHKLYKLLLIHMNRERMVLEVNQMTRMMTTLCRDDPIHGEEIKKQVFRRLFSP